MCINRDLWVLLCLVTVLSISGFTGYTAIMLDADCRLIISFMACCGKSANNRLPIGHFVVCQSVNRGLKSSPHAAEYLSMIGQRHAAVPIKEV